jgi:hypothetical protein
MIAPEPFFEPRGTPFSEFHRIRALTDLGHTVDLVTYPFGADVAMPGLRVFRCLRPPFIRGIGIGPSFAKVPLDLALTLTAIRRAMSTRYDVVRGTVLALPVGPGGGDETCFDNLGGPSLNDPTPPAVGSGFFYLSRGENTCGNGTYGTQGVHGAPGAPRTTTTCP